MPVPLCSQKAILLSLVAGGLVVGVALLIVLLPSPDSNPRPPQVEVAEGTLQGEWIIAATGETYASFRGVRYAEPPLGKLRFKAPRPASNWTGVQMATADGSKCFQPSSSGDSGSEDCLFLNIYTPQLPEESKELLPVFFLIHGGAFLTGSSRKVEGGPDFLIHENIVMVAPNYRLGLFGFLSLDTETIPGNAGLKDQIAALKWVYRNIANFGGDPQKIAVGGESAGAGSASWLSVLPETEGLINRVILMSGSASHTWAYTENYKEVTQAMGKFFKSTENTLSIPDLEELFMNAQGNELNEMAQQFSALSVEGSVDIALSPSPERRQAGREPLLIRRDAESYFWNRTVPLLPTLMGITNREWLTGALYSFGWAYNASKLKEDVHNLYPLMPKNIIPFEDTRRLLHLKEPTDSIRHLYEGIMSEVRTQYFDVENDSCGLLCQTIEFCDHVFQAMPTNRYAQFQAQHGYESTPLYMYRLSIKTNYSGNTETFNMPKEFENGAVHGDISKHFYHYDNLRQDYNGHDISSLTLRRITRMFSNFIRGSAPVPETDKELTVKWAPNRSSSPQITFLDINEQLSLRQNEEIATRFVEFWDNMYARYRDGQTHQ